MRILPVFLVFTLLLLAGARDAFDQWVAETELPNILADTSVEVVDRKGQLLRAYTVDGGLWRLGAQSDAVDPLYLETLLAYEDKRFWSHQGVDAWALARAVAQSAWYGRVVSGGSTLTMQVARLIEDSGTRSLGGKAAPDPTGARAGAAPEQARDP